MTGKQLRYRTAKYEESAGLDIVAEFLVPTSTKHDASDASGHKSGEFLACYDLGERVGSKNAVGIQAFASLRRLSYYEHALWACRCLPY